MRIAALAALAALVGCLVLAAGPAPLVRPATVPGAQPPAGAALQVFLDPVTGQQRGPTAAELASLAAERAAQASAKAALRPAAATPEEIHLPDGTVGLRLDARYYDTIVVCRQSDGRFGSECPANGNPK